MKKKKYLIILLVFFVLSFLYVWVSNPIPHSYSNNTLKISDNLEFVKVSSKDTLLKYNSLILVTPVIKEFSLYDSKLYIIQSPNKEFLNYTFDNGEVISLDEDKIYYWIIDTKTNLVEGIYTEEEFKREFSDIYKTLVFKKLQL